MCLSGNRKGQIRFPGGSCFLKAHTKKTIRRNKYKNNAKNKKYDSKSRNNGEGR